MHNVVSGILYSIVNYSALKYRACVRYRDRHISTLSVDMCLRLFLPSGTGGLKPPTLEWGNIDGMVDFTPTPKDIPKTHPSLILQDLFCKGSLHQYGHHWKYRNSFCNRKCVFSCFDFPSLYVHIWGRLG